MLPGKQQFLPRLLFMSWLPIFETGLLLKGKMIWQPWSDIPPWQESAAPVEGTWALWLSSTSALLFCLILGPLLHLSYLPGPGKRLCLSCLVQGLLKKKETMLSGCLGQQQSGGRRNPGEKTGSKVYDANPRRLPIERVIMGSTVWAKGVEEQLGCKSPRHVHHTNIPWVPTTWPAPHWVCPGKEWSIVCLNTSSDKGLTPRQTPSSTYRHLTLWKKKNAHHSLACIRQC